MGRKALCGQIRVGSWLDKAPAANAQVARDLQPTGTRTINPISMNKSIHQTVPDEDREAVQFR
jgi:hypothetical protein